MTTARALPLSRGIRDVAHPLTGIDDYAPLLERIGDARFVLSAKRRTGRTSSTARVHG